MAHATHYIFGLDESNCYYEGDTGTLVLEFFASLEDAEKYKKDVRKCKYLDIREMPNVS